MKKPSVSRTFGPIHFEDLDPHRFEDLVRELMYDFKDWHKIEATGRGGSDDGFDIRAYEKKEATSRADIEDVDTDETVNFVEGNMWMIQAKREKVLTPQKIQNIILDVSEKNPPYGYILIASTSFSKKSYDIFREELRKKGVMEFYLWGKAELEDMLHFPKNDRILFTFFGISLVSRRKSRLTEIRTIANIKNKLFRITGDIGKFYHKFLIRDLKDNSYPYKGDYKDFEVNPRWKEYTAFSHYSTGLLFHEHEFFCYFDAEKKEWDYTDKIDLIDEMRREGPGNNVLDSVRNFWEFIPREKRAKYVVDCLLKYSDIAMVDEKGDVSNFFPHLYVDFISGKGPFFGRRKFIKINENKREIDIKDDFKRISYFPKEFKKDNLKKIYQDKEIILNTESLKLYNEYIIDDLYFEDDTYNYLKSGDVIRIKDDNAGADEKWIQITYHHKCSIKNYLKFFSEPWKIQRSLNAQLGEDDKDKEINIFEFKRVYKWQLEKPNK